jgi:hypothetical protein
LDFLQNPSVGDDDLDIDAILVLLLAIECLENRTWLFVLKLPTVPALYEPSMTMTSFFFWPLMDTMTSVGFKKTKSFSRGSFDKNFAPFDQ